MLHFSYTFSRCLCQRKQNPKCLNHSGTFFSPGADKSNIYMHATWMGLLGPVTLFPLDRKSQTYWDWCSFWAEKASHTWTDVPFGQKKPDQTGPMPQSQTYLDQCSLWAGKSDLLGPVFPLGRKSQTYLDHCSLWAEKARLTWTNVPFVQEKPDQPGPMFPLGRKSQTKLDQWSPLDGKIIPTWTRAVKSDLLGQMFSLGRWDICWEGGHIPLLLSKNELVDKGQQVAVDKGHKVLHTPTTVSQPKLAGSPNSEGWQFGI